MRASSLGAALVPALSPVLSAADIAGLPFGDPQKPPERSPQKPPKGLYCCWRCCSDDHSMNLPRTARTREPKEQTWREPLPPLVEWGRLTMGRGEAGTEARCSCEPPMVAQPNLLGRGGLRPREKHATAGLNRREVLHGRRSAASTRDERRTPSYARNRGMTSPCSGDSSWNGGPLGSTATIALTCWRRKFATCQPDGPD